MKQNVKIKTTKACNTYRFIKNKLRSKQKLYKLKESIIGKKYISTKNTCQQHCFSFFSSHFLLVICNLIHNCRTQRQIIQTTNNFKFGKGNWMGISQYISIDYFHNLPKHFKNNQLLKLLFLEQDKALSSMRQFVLNYRLFFGLIRLSYQSIGVLFLVFLLVAIFLLNNCSKKIQSQIQLSVQYPSKRKTNRKHLRPIFAFFLANVLILIFFLFLTLSTFMSQISKVELNSHKICQTEELVGGFTINLIASTEVNIFKIVQSGRFLSNNSLAQALLNRHNIIFLYQNMCEIVNPYFQRIKQLQIQIRYAFSIGQFFVLYIIFGIHFMFQWHKVDKKSKRQNWHQNQQNQE